MISFEGTAKMASGRDSNISVFEVLLLGVKGFELSDKACVNYYILNPFFLILFGKIRLNLCTMATGHQSLTWLP